MDDLHTRAFAFFAKYFRLSGNILEVGSDMNCEVASYIKSTGCSVTALNPSVHFSPPAGILAIKDDARDMKSVEDNTFDAIVSVNTFEHIHALHVALVEMHRVLKPGGWLGSLWGPLWSSAKGHHLWAKNGDDIVSFWNPAYRNPLDDYSHLLLSPTQMRRQLLEKGEAPAMVEQIITAVFMRDDTTRWMHRHYLRALADSPFEIVCLEPHNRFEVPPDIDCQLHAKWGDHDFGVSSLRLAAQKLT